MSGSIEILKVSPRREWKTGPFLWISCCLTAAFLGSVAADHRKPEVLAEPLGTIATQIAGWEAVGQQSLPPGIFEKLRPTSYISRIYQKNQQHLGFFIAYYAQQRAGETMHSPKSCLPGNGWEIAQPGSVGIDVDGTLLRVNQYHVHNAEAHMLVLYWYQSRRYITANEYLGKLLLIKDAVVVGDTSAAIVRIMLPDEPTAPYEAVTFARALIPQVKSCFGK